MTLDFYLQMIDFWDIAPCTLGVDKRFKGAKCLLQG
jgi:hypothetical protein